MLGRTLGSLHHTARALLRPDEHVDFAENIAFSELAFARVLAAGRAGTGDLRVVLTAPALDVIAALTGQVPGFVYTRGAEPATAERLAAAPECIIAVDQMQLPGFSLPDGPLCVVDAWALPVGHWAQLLWANLLGLGPALWQALGAGLPGALRLCGGAIRAGSIEPYRVASHVNRVGRGARIHPRATLEGCVVGEEASIGAGAVVRGCILGAGARVEELALVEGSVLGDKACVQRLAMVKFSVVEAGAFAAGIQQLGVVGRGAIVKHGAILMDQRLGANDRVRVRVGGGLVDAPHGMLGVCVGPDAVIGSGVRIAAGRVIPAGLTVIADPAGIVSRVDVPAGVRVAHVANGGLQPLVDGSPQ